MTFAVCVPLPYFCLTCYCLPANFLLKTVWETPISQKYLLQVKQKSQKLKENRRLDKRTEQALAALI